MSCETRASVQATSFGASGLSPGWTYVKNSHDAIFGASYELPATVPRLGELPCCLTTDASHYRITMASSKRQVAAASPERVASSRRDVREQSRKGY